MQRTIPKPGPDKQTKIFSIHCLSLDHQARSASQVTSYVQKKKGIMRKTKIQNRPQIPKTISRVS